MGPLLGLKLVTTGVPYNTSCTDPLENCCPFNDTSKLVCLDALTDDGDTHTMLECSTSHDATMDAFTAMPCKRHL